MKTEDSTLTAICNSHLFKSLDDDGRHELLNTATTVSFAPQQIVVREGDPGEALFVIKSGTVEVKTNVSGNEVVLARLNRGACFGEVALLTGCPRTATVVTVDNVTLLCFYRHAIEKFLEDHPKVKKLLQVVLEGRAQDTIDKITRTPTPG